ncbi:RuBisCO large subunit C-terminal-like domain-containing protein [Microbacterium sp. NPDC079995]|uniref:RuBisCO large subunit C-terminal-like domain-containing protein n=1 Tax=unclassified Microbacterium TaxID=2609290 RepID=UPI00344BAF26
MRDPRRLTARYYIESSIEPDRAAALLAGEQSSGTFVQVPGESDELRSRHGAEVTAVRQLGEVAPALPSRTTPERVTAAEIDLEFPMENVGSDLATTLTAVAGNLFELGDLFACRLQSLDLPEEYVDAHEGAAFGVAGTRRLIGLGDSDVVVGTIVKPNVGLKEAEYRTVVRDLARASIDLIKDDELMTDPSYLPLETRVRVAMEEIDAAAQVTGKRTMYAFNITGDIAGLRQRHDLVVDAGGTCVMLTIPVMGLPALAYLRSFAAVPIHGHRGGLAASMRHPALGVSYEAWQKLARLAGTDHLHASGLGSKFYERDEEVSGNVRHLLTPLGQGEQVLPALSSGQNVFTPHPTWDALHTTDLLMLAGGGIAAHPGGPAAGVQSLRESWAAAVAGESLDDAARRSPALGRAVEFFGPAPR